MSHHLKELVNAGVIVTERQGRFLIAKPVLYLTDTGNSLYVAKRLGGELLSIPILMAEGRYKFKDDVIGIVSPLYGLGIPRLFERFLSKAELKANYRIMRTFTKLRELLATHADQRHAGLLRLHAALAALRGGGVVQYC